MERVSSESAAQLPHNCTRLTIGLPCSVHLYMYLHITIGHVYYSPMVAIAVCVCVWRRNDPFAEQPAFHRLSALLPHRSDSVEPEIQFEPFVFAASNAHCTGCPGIVSVLEVHRKCDPCPIRGEPIPVSFSHMIRCVHAPDPWP